MSNKTPIIEAQGLSKAFKSPQGPIAVLEDVHLSIYAGESLSIRGESGTGKTTLLYLLSLLEKPDAGQIHWEGQPVHSQTPNKLAKKRGRLMGFVFQSYYLIPELNAFENVLMGRRLIQSPSKEDHHRAQSLIERVGLASRAKSLPHQLSGGERQRIALARALINQPPIILADEPTGNLDEATGNIVMNLLLTLCQEEQRSLVLVTHNPSFAKKTDRQVGLQGHQVE